MRLKDGKHVGFANPRTLITDSWRTDQAQHQGQKQDQAAAAMPVPELFEEDWDQELVFPTHPIDWEQAASQAAAMGENEVEDVGGDQVKTRVTKPLQGPCLKQM